MDNELVVYLKKSILLILMGYNLTDWSSLLLFLYNQ